MRLAVVTNDYPPKPGGIQQYLGNLVDAWPDDVLVLAPKDGPATETRRGESVVRRGTRPFMWPTRRVASWVVAELDEFGPDYVLFGAPYPLTRLIGRVRAELGVPVGVLGHGAEVVLPAAIPGVRTLLRAALRSADVRFTVSRYTQRRLEALTGAPVVYVGAGVDLDAFRPVDRPQRDVPVVGCVSRFVPRKGQDRVMRAAARLVSDGTPVRVLLVGKGRTERRLRKEAERLDIDVEFVVGVPWAQLPAMYGAMDVFCMPCRSRWGGLEIEGLGLVFLEAAATGLPVLAGDSGGAPETVAPGTTGYVVRNVDDIVEGVTMILRDRGQAVEMGRRGRERVEREFTWRSVADRVEDGFRSVDRS